MSSTTDGRLHHKWTNLSSTNKNFKRKTVVFKPLHKIVPIYVVYMEKLCLPWQQKWKNLCCNTSCSVYFSTKNQNSIEKKGGGAGVISSLLPQQLYTCDFHVKLYLPVSIIVDLPKMRLHMQNNSCNQDHYRKWVNQALVINIICTVNYMYAPKTAHAKQYVIVYIYCCYHGNWRDWQIIIPDSK